MDADMKEKITMGMMVGCLLLALVAMFTTSWLTMSEDGSAESAPGAGDAAPAMEMHASLSTQYVEIDGMDCTKDLAKMMGGECDGDAFAMGYSDLCDDIDEDEVCEAATAGTVGAVFMWLGVVVTLILVLMAVLPMAGVDTLNDLMGNLPDICVTIMNWAAGGLMIAGVVLWLLLIPDGDQGLGYSAYLAIVAGLMGLGSTGMNTFMGDE